MRRQYGEGSLHERKPGLWCVQIDVGWVDGKRKRRTAYAKSQREAVAKMREMQREIAAGVTATANMSVETWLREWLATVDVKPRTAETYRSYVENYLIPAIGKHRLTKLQSQHVLELHRYVMVTKGRTSTTALHAHRVLSMSLEKARRQGKVSRNVATTVDAPRKRAVSHDALTVDQARAIFAAVGERPSAARWWMALLTGARQGEVLGLRWEHVDLAAGTVDLAWSLQRVPKVHGCGGTCGKRPGFCPQAQTPIAESYERIHLESNQYLMRPKTTRSRRAITVIPPLHAALRLHAERDTGPNPHGLVWHKPNGSPVDNRADWVEWQQILADAGLPPMPLHDARHATSNLMLALGVNGKVVQMLLGHSSLAQTTAYQYDDPQLVYEAMLRLGESLQLT